MFAQFRNQGLQSLILFAALVAFSLFTACDNGNSGAKVSDSPVSGELRIMVDEGFQPIISSAVDVFDSVYRLAKIHPTFTAEGVAVKALMDDSIQFIIIPRQLSAAELGYFKNRGYEPETTPIAHDAIAFILNPANNDTIISVEQLKGIFNGSVANWSEISGKSSLGKIQIVFDNPASSIVRYVRDSISGAALPPNAAALQNNAQVLDYVAKNKNAIGIIAANWISDTDDKGAQHFRSEIRIVDVLSPLYKKPRGPYQAYLQLNQYPYRRTMYCINGQPKRGVGLGFASFLAGRDGQLIILKDGMLPASMPPRIISVQ
ncbi:MAG: substrate-binding domain-containing protein [Chitinophagales bacterium]|nr:substrate-binding domain-containing protein [Chitinophagales bacterium]